MKKENIFIIQPKIQHYRLPIFDHLETKIKNKFNFFVLGKSQNGKAFQGGYREYINHIEYNQKLGIEWWSSLFLKINTYQPTIIIHTASPRNLSSWFLIFLSKFKKIKLIGWSKINSDNKTGSFLTNKIKYIFYNNFKILIVYGNKSTLELNYLKVKKPKIIVAHNTIDTNFRFQKKSFIKKNKEKIIKKFSLDYDTQIFVCIGRMIDEKKQINIINAWNLAKINKQKSKLFFIGSGPCLNKIKKMKKTNDNSICFVGNVPIGFDYIWLEIANFSVFGGALGLACQQSFLMKSLVIAPFEEGVDSEFLANEINSILYNKDDVLQLSKIMERIVKKETRHQSKQIVKNAYNYITRERTKNNMVQNIIKAINH